jgi:hypothetical protein
VEATWGLLPDIGDHFEIFAVHRIAALSFSRVSLYGGAGYYEASFTQGLRLETDDDFEIPGIGIPDLTAASTYEHGDDRGVTVIARNRRRTASLRRSRDFNRLTF